MRISWSWLSELVDLNGIGSPSALADLLTSRGLEVESIDRLDQGLDHVVSAQILEKKQHPQADRLSLCKVSTGSGEPLDIVCGAQNMKAGDKIALAQIGAHLPNGLKIVQGKIRGEISNGMLCSEEELKLKEKSEGILILPESTQLGRPLAEVLGLNDTLFTLKVTPNRSDCLSHFGIARELGAALGKRPKRPGIEKFKSNSDQAASPITVHLQAGEAGPQFFGRYIEGVKIGPSPAWLVKRLEVLGSRSINNVVDATNLVMLEMGQPTHAYDAKQIRGGKVSIRMARADEQIPLLDGTKAVLQGTELVIADEERPISLAGVMGGGNSEIQLHTQNIFLECAEFSPSLVRKASAKHQKKTEAAHRFERGVDPAGLPFAMDRLTTLVLELAGGQVCGSVVAQLPSRLEDSDFYKREIRFDTHYISDFLGFEREQAPLTLEKISSILESIDCISKRDAQGWHVMPPSYRLDLGTREDIAEEIARSVGYDVIPATIPQLTTSPAFVGSALPRWIVMDRAKESLVKSGLSETINFAFTSRTWLSKLGFPSPLKVANPLSEEFECLVPSLIPGLIQNALDNWNHHFGSEPLAVRLFEMRPTFLANSIVEAKNETTTTVEEKWKLSLLLSGPRYAEALRSERGEVDFYDLKAVIESLLKQLGTKGVRFQPMTASRLGGHPLFHPGQSVEVLAGNSVAGYFGLLHPGKAKELKVRDAVWLAELDWDTIAKLSRGAYETAAFKPWPAFPSIERDFSLIVKNDVTSEKLCQLAMKSGKPLAKVSKVFDIYQGSQVTEGMTSVAVRVIFYDDTRSIQESEAEAASARILDSWKKELGAELRG